MEIIMKNLPRDCTRYNVIRQLAYIFHGPGYKGLHPPINFDVYVYKDSRRLGMGALTLPTVEIANKFLRDYGDVVQSPPPKICVLQEETILFYQSRKAPRSDIVEKITRLPYNDPARAEQEEQRRNAVKSEIVNIRQIQFGWVGRDNVTFCIEWEYSCFPTGELTFHHEGGPPEILVTTNTSNTYDLSVLAIIRFPFSAIRYLSAHVDASTEEAIIYLTFWYPPSFETQDSDAMKRTRCSHLPLPGHELVAPYTSHAMRLVCSSSADLIRFRALHRIAQLSPTKGPIDTWSNQPIERRNIFTATALAQVEAFVRKQEWEVAFKLESLLRKSLVEVQEMLALIPEITILVRLKGSDYAAHVLKCFANEVQRWDPDSEEEEEFSSIQHCFVAARKKYDKQVAENSPDIELHRPLSLPKDVSVFTSYHVVITPTRMLLDGPFLDRSNSVIRWFDSSKHKYFLKVSFADEACNKYSYDRNIDGEAYIRSRFGHYLYNGLEIAGEKFDFLAYTLSSLREHTVWFLRPFTMPEDPEDPNSAPVQVDPSYILGKIGIQNFEGNLRRCPALFGARISQAFTASNASTIVVEETLFIDDIVTKPDGKYNYTDGVGTMSKDFARQVWTELKGTKRRTRSIDAIPAFQIRFGGSKGMLSVDYKLKGNVICVRPSMRKFATITNTIEVVECFERPRNVSLNRPLVMLLEDLGIKFEAFRELQDKAIEQTRRATENLTTAARLLENFGLGTSFRLTSLLLELSRLGLDDLIQADPFYQSMLKHAVHHILRELKHRSRIPIEGAWNLVGVADIHGYLNEGEVFAAVKPTNGPVQYLTGEVLVMRSPVIHPGDVQLARAIGKPPMGSCFEHEPLVNTVVFPTKGTRPMPSMLGGGDLDGDTYSLIPLNLHPNLRPAFTVPPADYLGPRRKLVEHDCTLKDVAEFIIEYIQSDLVGLIATRWLVLSDQNPEGIFHPDCKKLAELHSDAVDYLKTGYPVDPETMPKLHFNTNPDWHAPENVDPNSSRYYESKRAVGLLSKRVTLQDMESNIPIPREQQRRMRSSHPKASSSVTLYLNPFSQEDDLHRVLKNRFRDLEISIQDPNEDTQLEIFRVYQNYISVFEGLCTAYTATESSLCEEEVILGTIAAKISDLKGRKEKMSNLRNHSHMFVKDTIRGLMGETDLDNLEHAWYAYDLARKEVLQGTIGARSFQYISLGLVLGTLKGLEEEAECDKGSIGLKRKRSTESKLDQKRARYTTTQRHGEEEEDVLESVGDDSITM